MIIRNLSPWRALLAIAALATACTAQPQPRPQAGPPAPPRNANPEVADLAADVLGSVNGVEITRAHLPTGVADQLREIENEMLQRRFHMLWAGLEDAVDERLIAAEAERRGITKEQLEKQEIDAKAEQPSEEMLRRAYDQNAEIIGVPYEVAAPYLKEQLAEGGREAARRALVAELRATADVRYSLPIPQLPRIEISVDGAPGMGPENAKVTLVEFSDFECPYCSRARGLVHELRAQYPNDLRVVYRDFPLEQHPNARPAAEAAFCADEQGAFWAYHDLLFDNQGALGAEDLRRYAEEVELDPEKFEACLESPRPAAAVAEDVAAGREYGVDGTPSLFLNGMKLIGIMPLPLMKLLIERELGR